MITDKQRVDAVAGAMGVRIRYLSDDEYERIIASIIARFAPRFRDVSGWLWEFVDGLRVERFGIRSWIEEFLDPNPVILIFDSENVIEMAEVSDGTRVRRIASDAFLHDFYITNTNIEFLLACDHHNGLTAAGTAIPWLAKRSGASLS